MKPEPDLSFLPTLMRKSSKETLALGMVSMPGCMSPTEIVAADKAGADFIKLVSGRNTGYQILQDIYAPLHHVKYIATVGVTEETFVQVLEAWVHRCRYQLTAGR